MCEIPFRHVQGSTGLITTGPGRTAPDLRKRRSDALDSSHVRVPSRGHVVITVGLVTTRAARTRIARHTDWMAQPGDDRPADDFGDDRSFAADDGPRLEASRVVIPDDAR